MYAPKEPGTYSVTASVTYWCYDQDTMLHYNKTLSTTLTYQVVVPYTAWFKVAGDNDTDQTSPYPGMAPPFSFCYFDATNNSSTSDPSAPRVGFSFLQPDGSGRMELGYWGYVRNDTPYSLDYNVIQIVKQNYFRQEWADGTAVETTFDKALDVFATSTSFYWNSPSVTVEPDVTTRLKPVITDVGPDGSPMIFYPPFGRDTPAVSVPKVDSVHGQLVKMEWRVQFETHLTIMEPDHGGVPVSVSMAAWSIGGQLSYNSTTNSYSGSATSGSVAVPMPPNPFTPSNTPWMADGDNNRHYLEWSGVAKVWGNNGYQQDGGQQAALAVNWS
ncbi:MAG: hypothetical protein ABI353_15030, partial [Isosphaeraceae bacterium]